MQFCRVRKCFCQKVWICQVLNGSKWDCVETAKEKQKYNNTTMQACIRIEAAQMDWDDGRTNVRISSKFLFLVIDGECHRSTATATEKDVARRCVCQWSNWNIVHLPPSVDRTTVSQRLPCCNGRLSGCECDNRITWMIQRGDKCPSRTSYDMRKFFEVVSETRESAINEGFFLVACPRVRDKSHSCCCSLRHFCNQNKVLEWG